jgi:signal transduction histidine kinase
MGKGEPEPQRIDVNDVVRVITDILRAEAASRGVMLSADLDERPLPALADPVHLQQVVLNLALNGMDAMLGRPAGHRQMTVAAVLADPAIIKVAISDTGTGIPPDRLKDIFEPYFTTKRQGMGLGLSIARTIIEQSGGRIWAENRPDGGATFSFTLPVAEKSAT